MTDIAVASWNTQWAPHSGRGVRVKAHIADLDADILVITEGQHWLLPDGGHAVDAGTDWGYDAPVHRRKTLLWSRWPLTDVVRCDRGAGNGRVVAARTTTPIGLVQILGVCIPWMSAHVTTGRKDTPNWSEHLECCDQIAEIVAGCEPDVPVIMAGDFNQRIPRGRQPVRVAERLSQVLAPFTVHTAGDVEHGPLIDHIASTLDCVGMRTWPGRDDGGALSDHSGVVCRLRSASTDQTSA
ncbi:endonuclease/exonuclease/phosphatase family protein [Gordonia sp. NPDC003950]